MQTKTLVEASAEVVTIITLKKGDVYRRLETSTYSPDKVRYGIVTDVQHNGEQAYIAALEVEPSDDDVHRKTFGTEADLALFSCTPAEWAAAAADARTRAVRSVTNAEAELDKKRANLTLLDELRTTVDTEATAPETATV